MSAKRGTKGPDKAPASFDESLERLEEVVGQLEEGGLGLEESLDRYKEGVGLLKGCRERLASFRAQVEELTAEGIIDHDGDPDAGDPADGETTADEAGDSGPPGAGSLSGLDTPF